MRRVWLAVLVLAGCGSNEAKDNEIPEGLLAPMDTLEASACSGAAGPPSTAVGGQRHVLFRVQCGVRDPGRCMDGATAFGDVCDRLLVRVDNTGYTNGLDVGSMQWEMRDGEGRTSRFSESSRDVVPAGEVREVTLGFTVDDGGPVAVELRYVGFQGKGNADVPAYA